MKVSSVRMTLYDGGKTGPAAAMQGYTPCAANTLLPMSYCLQ